MKPRIEISFCEAETCIMSMPATRRRSSGIFVMPESWMSWLVMTAIEFAASRGDCAAPRDAVTTASS